MNGFCLAKRYNLYSMISFFLYLYFFQSIVQHANCKYQLHKNKTTIIFIHSEDYARKVNYLDRKSNIHVKLSCQITHIGATNVSIFTFSGCLAARATASIDPREWATMWEEPTLYITSDCSIISICSLSVYSESNGFGSFRNPIDRPQEGGTSFLSPF